MITDQIACQLAHAIATKGQASLVVCGGSSPISIFAALSAGAHEAIVDWSHVTITLVDDRLVPADHQHSNQKLVYDYLLCGAAAATTPFRWQSTMRRTISDSHSMSCCLAWVLMVILPHYFPIWWARRHCKSTPPDDFRNRAKGIAIAAACLDESCHDLAIKAVDPAGEW